jgi:hypothetical protein
MGYLQPVVKLSGALGRSIFFPDYPQDFQKDTRCGNIQNTQRMKTV